MSYQINEVFYSIQGEGVRVGTPNVFVRFSGCNLTCRTDNEAGFDCDTEFASGRKMELDALHDEMIAAMKRETTLWSEDQEDKRVVQRWCILTGGEPSLQVDAALVNGLRQRAWKVAIETNGTKALPDSFDWVCCSPKSAEHTLRLTRADEIKYVRNYGQGIPRPSVKAEHYLISPAFRSYEDHVGAVVHEMEPGALDWCIKLVKENPPWRLSIQMHKAWGVR
jgi:organic radical activating enzyme